MASSGVVFFLENAMRDLCATLCRGITRQVLAMVPLRARVNGRPVVAGLPVPTDDLVPSYRPPTPPPHSRVTGPGTLISTWSAAMPMPLSADSFRGASCLPLRPHLRHAVTLCVCRY